jgi:hypothetical protein
MTIEALLCTGDDAIAAAVSAAGAAVQRSVVRVDDAEALIGRWREARVVLVGADLAVLASRLGLPSRKGVYVLADASAPASALSASVPLGAGTIVLPEGGTWLGGRTGGTYGSGPGRVADRRPGWVGRRGRVHTRGRLGVRRERGRLDRARGSRCSGRRGRPPAGCRADAGMALGQASGCPWADRGAHWPGAGRGRGDVGLDGARRRDRRDA